MKTKNKDLVKNEIKILKENNIFGKTDKTKLYFIRDTEGIYYYIKKNL